jgi:predicted DNA-binding protein YlxM (UPF0122 family)
MAAIPKISEKQKKEIAARYELGESMRKIALSYNVTEGAIRKLVGTHIKPLKAVAKQLATAELAMESFSIGTQVKIRTMTDTLKGITEHISSAAEYSARNAHRLSVIANGQIDKIDEVDPMLTEDAMRSVAALTKMANEASQIPINLLNASKEQLKTINLPDDVKALTLDEFYAQIGK